MPIKTDESGKRWVEMHFLVPGTPEAVWQAMATGPGNTAWFAKAAIEERVGGALSFTFGPDMGTKGEVTAWEPPHKFGYVEREWMPGAPPVETEVYIAGRADGQCAVRMIHWIATATDEWNHHLEGFESGWPGFFNILRIYLAHFAGQPAASFQVTKSVKGESLELWRRLTERLGLAAANVGERRSISGPEQPFSSVVQRVQQDDKVRTVLLRIESPTPGIFLAGAYGAGENIHVSVSYFIYGSTAAETAKISEPQWQAWFTAAFPEGVAPEFTGC